ncbi:mechanosensitive ion channel family protein [Iamia sp. SCSIO 61187]|uniref:mechanosensitive ion channel family protein n=1 Tax=Iamia sp. SCSIO 61187 TaxID=2722752 RepID=UPI001C63965D|nr:mechanosensitive ion channel family protein [Iamia sp. SCSIO 61187]QYG91447.1 mechanosensitive ion channel family protein [Iamia sp. SCSIO 61187]
MWTTAAPPDLLRAATSGGDDQEDGAAYRWVLERTDSEGWAEVASWMVDKPLRIAIIWVVAWLLSRVVRRLIRRFSDKLVGSVGSGRLKRARDRAPSILVSAQIPSVRSAARAETISGVLKSVSSGVIYVFAFVYTLEVLGLNLGPLIAGAGVVGVALGFGAQSMVRDFLAGTFILLEDQYGVGDVVDLGEAIGTVEALNLRTTRLRDVNGTVWHVPNGEILRVGNQSQQWARAVLDIVVAHGTDVDAALKILKEAADDVAGRPEMAADVLEEAEVWGVEALTQMGVTLRLVIKTRPGSQWKVMRALRHDIGHALAEAGIRMSAPVGVIPPPAPPA